MKDLLLDATGDLAVSSSGDISITDSVSQAIKIRLQWFAGEWKFNEELGIPYFDEVLVKGGNDFRTEQLIREQILSVDEVTEVISLTITANKAERTLTISFEAKAGSEYISEEVMVNA